ncbi:MAG TPA: N-6 DNA methylase, partial [Vicinamibacterales bacterium]|nr:N-6 DNA methylase [Vicinamibacterales bacterium]
MIDGVRGRLVTASFARSGLGALAPGVAMPPEITRQLSRWAHRVERTLGPASSVRAIADVAVLPLLAVLGYDIRERVDTPLSVRLRAVAAGHEGPSFAVLVAGWGEPLHRVWRAAIVDAIAIDAGWCLCCNGVAIRIVDARRTWSREHLEFDIEALGRGEEAQRLLWLLASNRTMAMSPPLLDRAVESSARHGIEVCRALGAGVLDALSALLASLRGSGAQRHSPGLLFEQALTVLYRILFLLFAEARGLVPMWHPVYRDRYSVETLVSTLLSGGRCRGLWPALQAISRMAHAGCAAGELRVTAFNGRLFAPSHVAALENRRIPDQVLARAMVSVSSTPVVRPLAGGSTRLRAEQGDRPRARIAFSELDVEQLGAVYEQVLEYQPAPEAPAALARTRDVRKSTGTFYTPRAVTTSLVRRTLEPLVRGRSAEDILSLKVVDPAMGSGAFLVAACRYLAAAAEEALIAEGRWHPHDVTPADRALLRREVAARCLYGADLNPMAVQLARLSLWLATLAADKPLSFLDHHLITGDSLIGATAADVARQPGGGRGPRARERRRRTLFDDETLNSAIEHAVDMRLAMAAQPDDSAAVVHAKEAALADLRRRDGAIGRWWRVFDLWCAGWFWEDGRSPDRAAFDELKVHLLAGSSSLPDHVAAPMLAEVERIAGRRRFLHWGLAFPEVFADRHGRPRPDGGFDAVLGNPPWDMVRGDTGDGGARAEGRREARQLVDFVRDSGVYRVAAQAHVNRYQLFVERAMQLVRRGGRIGLVLPSGLVFDAGAAPLRRWLFDRADVDDLWGIDNRRGIFATHRGLRFLLLTCTAGGTTRELRCRFGITDSSELEAPQARPPVVVTRALIARVSGEDDLGVPELLGPRDLTIVERITQTVPRLGAPDGWSAHFGRELNATDDRHLFVPVAVRPGARVVIEGKHIEPFRA